MTGQIVSREKEALDACERIIERGLATFVEVGRALAEIRDRRYYRESHDTFEAYCQQRWNLSRTRAYELINAQDVVSAIADIGNEAQARELGRVPEADRADVWAEANEHTGGKPTAAAIRDVRVKREHKEAERERKRQHNRALANDTAPLPSRPERRYPTIILDPPWSWDDEGDHDQLGRARPTYHTMSLDEIKAMPVGDQVESNAHIYLWITNRSLYKGFALLEAWGFRYITMLTWCKPHFGMGNYFRGQTEHVLFGVRGSLPLLRKDRGTWFMADRNGQHSAKPAEFYQLVEECSPGPWLEVFARGDRPGWVQWGAEAE